MRDTASSGRGRAQDSPTPAGNSVAVIVLMRLYAYTDDPAYREKAEQTLEVFADAAEQFGISGATYGIAAVHFSQPHEQVVVIGDDDKAKALRAVALQRFSFTQTLLQLAPNQVVAQNLPPALATTIPNLPDAGASSVAVVCRGTTCQPPTGKPEELRTLLQIARSPAA